MGIGAVSVGRVADPLSASTTRDAPNARSAVVPAFASTTRDVVSAQSAVVSAFASTTRDVITAQSAAVAAAVSTLSCVQSARCAAAAASASTKGGVLNAQRAAAAVFASTTRDAAIALNARIYHAPWKGAHSLAIASAAHKIYCSTCAPNTAANLRRLLKSKS